jgi:hypothetical protein|tara:strand:+ start:3161 stop:3292 length:132 start_codon:yes stop_codon:yes gene_type:complete
MFLIIALFEGDLRKSLKNSKTKASDTIVYSSFRALLSCLRKRI